MIDHCSYFGQIAGWPLGTRENILVVRYEELLADEEAGFARILDHLGLSIPQRKLDAIVRQCSFRTLSGGRERGQEDLNSHFRKGVANDWQNHMAVGSRLYEAFEARAGHLVRDLGYGAVPGPQGNA